ncbi:MAG: fimbrillin family protein [Tannerellaceae bacterium]|nr:fimbrillin family protein [Tannerellaceae bacterium]
MKHIVGKTFLLAASVIALGACNSDDDKNENVMLDKTAITIHTGIATKATDTTWESGDAIGVYMYNPDTTAIINNQTNFRYVTSQTRDTATFVGASADQILYFPQNGDNIRLKAYYPYNTSLSGSNYQYPLNVSQQTTLQNIDLMTAVHTTGFNKNDANVHLHFYHRMTKLIFILEREDADDTVDFTDCTLTIGGMYNQGTYEIFDNRFLDDYSNQATITVPQRATDGQDTEAGDTRIAIVFPRPAGAGVTFTFTTTSGDTYVAEMSEDLDLLSGYQYTFIITLSKNAVTNVTADIEPWNDGGTEEYEAR